MQICRAGDPVSTVVGWRLTYHPLLVVAFRGRRAEKGGCSGIYQPANAGEVSFERGKTGCAAILVTPQCHVVLGRESVAEALISRTLGLKALVWFP